MLAEYNGEHQLVSTVPVSTLLAMIQIPNIHANTLTSNQSFLMIFLFLSMHLCLQAYVCVCVRVLVKWLPPLGRTLFRPHHAFQWKHTDCRMTQALLILGKHAGSSLALRLRFLRGACIWIVVMRHAILHPYSPGLTSTYCHRVNWKKLLDDSQGLF